MEKLSEYGLTLVVINDDFHLYDLVSKEVYEVMTLSYIEQLLDYSFPSGHAMAITCLYGLFIYYLYHSKLKYRKLLISGCIIIILFVTLSRIYLGVHYFSDVFGGVMLSLSLIMYMSNIPSFNA